MHLHKWIFSTQLFAESEQGLVTNAVKMEFAFNFKWIFMNNFLRYLLTAHI